MSQGWEIEDFLTAEDGVLHIDGVSTVELAREHGTPLFVVSERRVRRNIDRVKAAGDVIGRPVKVCYAAKAMSTMGILRVVKNAGCDIEVNSGGELWKALRAGFTGEQIIFNGTSKEVWELELAVDNGIYAIQVDSLYELSLIEQTAARLNKQANVSLRLVPEIESSTHSGLQTALITSKFGMMPVEAFRAFRTYKDSPHLLLNGIHLHVGSQNPDPTVYGRALGTLFDALVRIKMETDVSLQHVNLGGGFPVNYLPADAPDFPAEQEQMLEAQYEPSSALRDAWSSVEQYARRQGAEHLLPDLTILLEPGRSIIADAVVCLTNVRNAKHRPVPAGDDLDDNTGRSDVGQDEWLLTDAGFNILLSMETYKWYYHLISATRAAEPHETPYKMAGPLCDGGDVYFDIEGHGRLPDHRMLPVNVGPGEVLAFLNCGAYSLAQASQYNGRFLPAVVLIEEDGTPTLIRRRDRFEDLIANDL
jgi:D-ornithine/D-lysine decarboxylase